MYKTDYSRPFRFLPPDEPLTEELLRRVLVGFDPSCRDRLACYVAFNALAKFAGLVLGENFKRLRGEYKPGDRYIPDDEEIVRIRHDVKNPGWRWLFGMLAAYGLRPHEIFHLDLDRFPVVLVKSGTKTGERLVYPVFPGVWESWDLNSPVYPKISIAGKSNKVLGSKVSSYFCSLKLGIQPYSLRDAYAVRCAVLGIDSAIASKWMGHGLDVHFRHYQKYIDEVAMSRIWEKLGKD